MDDTICAVATYPSNSAISIIRISGNDAINKVNLIFKGTDLLKQKSHTIHYGFINDGKKDIDEVLISIMKSPKTFTREDVVEINTHGSIVIVNEIIELLLKNGIRLAEPGEFTKRAYLNGRIDLNQAEAVMDLISAKTDVSKNMALNQLKGKPSEMINDLREDLIKIITNIEVNIDYPEYDDIPIITINQIKKSIKKIKTKINQIVKETTAGKYLKNGIKTLILGKPNVGKSSLLNSLIGEEKAIVTEIAGTTRDIVEGTINLDGIILNIIDTAGIRETTDKIENFGITKSMNLIDDADLILIVLDNSRELSIEDKKILDLTKDKKRIIIINKIDTSSKLNIEINELVVKISALKNKGIDLIKLKIKELFNLDDVENKNYNYFSSARTLNIIEEVQKDIINLEQSLIDNLPLDILSIDIRRIYDNLGRINGTNYDEEFLDELFKRFCVGK